MKTISSAIDEATEILRQSGIAEPRREAKSLLVFAIGKDQTFLVAHSDNQLSSHENKLFQEILARRARHEPLQYIKGHTEFFGLDFFLSPDVLIPRPETELIVEHAIEILREKPGARFCEVGIGSGCISVAILHALSKTGAIGLDISEAALEIAQKNAEKHTVSNRLELRISNIFDQIGTDNAFDLIVSNPPYVAAEDFQNLQAEVRDYEPRVALTDETDGLSIIRKIVEGAPRFLKPEGFLLMEIGFDQSSRVAEMLSKSKWENVEFLPDLQGIPRMLKAKVMRGNLRKSRG